MFNFHFVELKLCPDIVRSNSNGINVVSVSVFYSYYFGRCLSKLVDQFQFHILVDSLVILIGCMIFLSPFLHVKRMLMSTASFLTQLDFGFFPAECFLLTYNLNGVFYNQVFYMFFILHALLWLPSLVWSELQIKSTCMYLL